MHIDKKLHVITIVSGEHVHNDIIKKRQSQKGKNAARKYIMWQV